MEPNLSPPRRRRAFVLVTALTIVAPLTACSNGGSAPEPASGLAAAGEPPALVSIAGGDVVVGFQRGHLRSSATVPGLRITKHPVTVADYRGCVTKGACSAPAMRTPACLGQSSHGVLDRATYAVVGGDALPVTCATIDQASQYCAWVGGALPTMEQWMLASRGPSVARYAWGNDEPTCDQRVVADGICAPYAVPAFAPTHDVIAALAVGGHAKGASPSGVEDVLLTPGELLAPSPGALFTTCAPPNAGCVVGGMSPASIDAVAPISDAPSLPTPSFRCALPEVSQ